MSLKQDEDRLTEELRVAQKYLRAELGSDWNDLCKVLYEGRVLAAMYRYKHNQKVTAEIPHSGEGQPE